MSLLSCRQSIIDSINTAIPEIGGNCQAHGGRFDAKELKRVAMKSPAVLIACLGVEEATYDGGGGDDIVAIWGAFIVTTDRPGVPRDASVLAIATALLIAIPLNRWGRDDTSDPEKIHAQNLYSGTIDTAGMALWGISWRQKISFGRLDPESLDIFAIFHADWDYAKPDGHIDLVDHLVLQEVPPEGDDE